MNFNISSETAKQLNLWGCDLSSISVHPMWWVQRKDESKPKLSLLAYRYEEDKLYVPAYHILEDICCVYRDVFFKKNNEQNKIIENILIMIKDNKKELAEEYILKNTIFNSFIKRIKKFKNEIDTLEKTLDETDKKYSELFK